MKYVLAAMCGALIAAGIEFQVSTLIAGGIVAGFGALDNIINKL